MKLCLLLLIVNLLLVINIFIIMAESLNNQLECRKAGLTTSTHTIKNLRQLLRKRKIYDVPYSDLSKTIYPALPGTFLLINLQNKQITFVDGKGEAICSFYPEYKNLQIQYLSPSQVLISENTGSHSKLSFWNLSLPPKIFTISSTTQKILSIIVFERSKSVCWIKQSKEKSILAIFQRQNIDYILTFEYFKIDKSELKDRKQLVYPIKLKPEKNLTIKKLDNTSKFGLFTQTDLSKKMLQFKVCDMNRSPETFMSSFSFHHNIYNNSSIHQITLADAWLIDPCTFYFRFQAELNEAKYIKQGRPSLSGNQHQIQRQFDILWNYKQNKVSLLNLGIPQRFYQIQFANSLRKINKIYKLYYKNSKQKQFLELPVYLVYLIGGQLQLDKKIQSYYSQPNKTNKIIIHEIENRLIKYQFEKDELKISDSTINQFLFPQIQIYAYFMEEIIPGCDDDLIYLAVHFLCDLY